MTTAEEDVKNWGDKYLEGKQEKKIKKEINPFDYVTIPLKEYRKLLLAKYKAEKKIKAKYEAKITEIQSDKDMYQRWYREKSEALEQAKAQIAEMLGLQELQKVKEQEG